MAWENSLHFVTPPLVFPSNDVWGTSAEIPFWWLVTIHICSDWWFREENLPQPMRSLQSFLRRHFEEKTVYGVAKYRLFSQVFLVPSMLKHVSASIWNDSDSREYIVARFKHAKRCSNIYHARTSFILKTALKHKAFLQISRFIQVCESQLYVPGIRLSNVPR